MHKRNPMHRRKPEKPETSKRLAIIVTNVFICTVAIAWISWFKTGEVPPQLLNFVSVPFMVVVSGYFTKSCIENCNEINAGSAGSGRDGLD